MSSSWQLDQAVGALRARDFHGVRLEMEVEGDWLRVIGDHSPGTQKTITMIVLSVDPDAVAI
jgi:hypothetical protein